MFQLRGLAGFCGKITSKVEKYTFYIGGLSKILFTRKIEKISIFLGLEMVFYPTHTASYGMQTLYFVFLCRFSLIFDEKSPKTEFWPEKFEPILPHKCPCASLCIQILNSKTHQTAPINCKKLSFIPNDLKLIQTRVNSSQIQRVE